MHIRAYLLTISALCFLASSALAADGYRRVTGIDIIHYRIGLTIDDTDSVVVGETGITTAFNQDGVTQIPLDLGEMTVDGVMVDKAEAAFTHDAGKLVVTLPKLYKKGERAQITVRYHGQPRDGLFIMRNKFGDRTIFADNFSNRAHHWFPGIDHPYDKATAEFVITAPDDYDVIAPGRLVERTHLGNDARITRWKTQTEIPTYCMVIGATQFSVIHAGAWSGIPVSYYLYPQDREKGMFDFERSLRMLEFYTTLIGPYPYAKLALVQSTTRYGGMENASAIFFSERSIRGEKRNEGTVAHEIAHQWFGDSVTENDWHDVWLSEGFATYFGALFFERDEGRDRFMEIMTRNKARYLRTHATTPSPIHDPRITDLSDVLTSFHYVKGAWVLHMLRGIMGDNAFFAGIRDYYRTYRDENASTQDLQRVMESHADRPLDWFFEQWIYEPGHPVYDLDWTWNASSKQAEVRIRQTQDGTTFRMPMELAFYNGDEIVREKVQVDGKDQRVTVSLATAPERVVLDPDGWVLKEMSQDNR